MDEFLRRLKRRAQTGDPDATEAYIAMLERIAGVGSGISRSNINPIQSMYLELMRERYPEFTEDLIANKRHWHGAVLSSGYSFHEFLTRSEASPTSGYFYAPAHHPLIVLRDIEQDYLNQDTVYLLIREGEEHVLAIRDLAQRHGADEYNEYPTHEPRAANFVWVLCGGMPEGRLVRIWWD